MVLFVSRYARALCRKLRTYTRCQDLVSMEGDNYPAVVGGFNDSGLSVSYDFSDDSVDSYSVTGCRRFARQP
jgi:hypothetical protein